MTSSHTHAHCLLSPPQLASYYPFLALDITQISANYIKEDTISLSDQLTTLNEAVRAEKRRK